MKRVIFIAAFSVSSFFAQAPDTSFWKIGFNDWTAYFPGSHPAHFGTNQFYFPQLRELGLSHIVTYGHSNHPFNANYNKDTIIKVLDRIIDPYSSQGKILYRYCRASGNDSSNHRYEVGGVISNPGIRADEYGFGNTTQTSFWLRDLTNTTGNRSFFDQQFEKTVFFADMSNPNHIKDKYLLNGLLAGYHQPLNQIEVNRRLAAEIVTFYYNLVINAKIDGNYTNDDTVAVVYLSEEPHYTDEDHNQTYRGNFKIISQNELLDTFYIIKASDFGGNNYINLQSPFSFRKYKGKGSKLRIQVQWKKTRNLYIDYIYVFDNFYNDLFLAPQAVRDSISDLLASQLNYNPTNQLDIRYDHLYFDEPYPMNFFPIKRIDEISNWLINGSNRPYEKVDAQISKKMRENIPYVQTTQYVLTDDVSHASTGSNNLQNALQRLIYHDSTVMAGGIQLDLSNGLRVAKEWAGNFTPEPYDDVPFIHTIQCQAEYEYYNDTIPYLRFRAPTPNEILVQGWLAMCYGATGIMYYNIATTTSEVFPPPPVGWHQYLYGLFDDHPTEQFISINNEVGRIQSIEKQQYPNSRFYAVKELNQQIDLINLDIMNLVWNNAYSFHKSDSRASLFSNTYIKELVSYFIPSQEQNPIVDHPDESFIEIGIFDHKYFIGDSLQGYFMIVNRRCLPTEYRDVKIKIDKSGTNPSYNNWRVIDVASGESWIVSNNGNGYVTIGLAPGRGRLLKLEPVILGGGTLVYNETLPSGTNINVKGSVTVGQNATLSIGHSSTLNFLNSSSLSVKGQLNVNGTYPNLVTLNFQQPNDNGIKIKSGGAAIIKHTNIQNASTGIETESGINNLKIYYSNFTGCTDYGVNILGSASSVPHISYCQFTGSQTGINASGVNSVVIKQNTINNTQMGISLIQVLGEAHIIRNIISSSSYLLHGILANSSAGYIRENTISGFSPA